MVEGVLASDLLLNEAKFSELAVGGLSGVVLTAPHSLIAHQRALTPPKVLLPWALSRQKHASSTQQSSLLAQRVLKGGALGVQGRSQGL